ncbi:MAG: alpha-N-arabinofuranosidase [Nitrospiraceae bacterium]|nr:alpha-N-arabinofuranosidase [Nitrospiraceae bacterium]
MSEACIRIWPELPKATINPNIYGHFAEHLGRCVYEGIWVGPKSEIPNQDGIRVDVIAALKQLRAPVVRWPGGCFADQYHWRDGVKPLKKRPQTTNIWWQQSEPNEFGTDEFMRFCAAVGCEPYICLNVGSGSPREALGWLEYCNFGGDSILSKLRAHNGHPEPYGIKYWGVGNENWGCGGRFTATDYAKEYTRYASYLRAFDPGIEMIACGASPGDYKLPTFVDWNHDFCAEMIHADLIDHLSIHRYFNRGTGATFSDSEYAALFGDLVAMERDIQQADRLLGYFYPDRFVGLIIDEWGLWHPSAVVDNGLEQVSTLRDAVFAAAALNLFNNYAHRVTMTNIAQTINVLQAIAITDGGAMCLTPTYYVYDMMRFHMAAQSLTHELDCPTFDAHPMGLRQKHSVPQLSVSASLARKKILLTVANQTVDADIETRIDLRGAKVLNVLGRVLNSADPRDANTIEAPKTIFPKRLKREQVDGELVHTFPAHSVTSLSISLA